MPVDWTCACGLYVHPIRRNFSAIHMRDCSYNTNNKEQHVREEGFSRRT